MRQREFQALAKQLLPDLPGWRLKGPLLLWPPVDHTLRAVCFEPSGFDRDSFYLWVFILPLCMRHEHLMFNMGHRLGFSWERDDPNLLMNLLVALRNDAIPFLDGLDTPRDVVEAIKHRWLESEDPHVYQAVAYMLALYGDRTEALAAMDDLLRRLDTGYQRPWKTDMANEARMLKAKLLEDPDGARRMLAEWEAESRRNLKLEEFSSAALMAAEARNTGRGLRTRGGRPKQIN
jgi:hypothetical protein